MGADNSKWLFWYVIIPMVLIISAIHRWNISRRLKLHYWSKPCTGQEWKKNFPDASKYEIRDFLDIFVNAFGFGKKHRLSFSPSDKVIDVYHTLYPTQGLPDGLEIESFVGDLERKYGVSVADSVVTNVTLGELFASTRHQSH